MDDTINLRRLYILQFLFNSNFDFGAILSLVILFPCSLLYYEHSAISFHCDIIIIIISCSCQSHTFRRYLLQARQCRTCNLRDDLSFVWMTKYACHLKHRAFSYSRRENAYKCPKELQEDSGRASNAGGANLM